MKAVLFKLMAVLVIASMFVFPQQVLAQPQPPQDEPQPGQDVQGWPRLPGLPSDGGGIPSVEPLLPGVTQQDGEWAVDPASASPDLLKEPVAGDIQAQAVKRDSFGNSMSAVAFSWQSAQVNPSSSFTLSGNSSEEEIVLPFTFNFYEHAYTSLRVARYGYLVLGNTPYVRSQSALPYPGEPNDVIAPFWTPANTAQIYIKNGGAAPDRWTIIEWIINKNSPYSDDTDVYNFEAVLHEDGSILFQHNSSYNYWGWWCAVSGIEDSTGTVGLVARKYCQAPPQEKAYLFKPPAVGMARVRIFPLQYGEFATLNDPAVFHLTLENTGTLGDDQFNLVMKSKWPYKLYDSDGVTELLDTNGDKKINTPLIPMGASQEIVVKIWPPAKRSPGMTSAASLKISSSVNPKIAKTVALQTTIPFSFAQAYAYNDWFVSRDNDYSLVTSKKVQSVTSSPGVETFDAAIVETENGSIFRAWTQCEVDDCTVQNIYYSVVDHYNTQVLPPTRLESVKDAGATKDYGASMAATDDGKVAIVWLQDGNPLHFALFDQNGAQLTAPRVLGPEHPDIGYPVSYDSLKAAALQDHNFVLTWHSRYNDNNSVEYDEIWSAVVKENGDYAVSPAGLATDDIGDNMEYWAPNAQSLPSGRYMIYWGAWKQKGNANIIYSIYNADGSPYKSLLKIPAGAPYLGSPDAALMANGQVLVSWPGYKSGKDKIYYAVLNAGTYSKKKGPVALAYTGGELTGSWFVSVAADAEGHGILSWTDSDDTFARHYYYAAVGKNGVLLTKPVIYMNGVDSRPLVPSYKREGLSSYRPISIKWFVGLGAGSDPSQVPIEQAVVNDYNALHDDVKVTMEVVGNDLAVDQLAKEIAAGTSPDIVGPVGWLGSNSFYGQYLDLQPYITKTSFDTSIFNPTLAQMYQTEEGTVGLPFAVYPSAVIYNKTLFSKAGLSYPPSAYGMKYTLPGGAQVDWTWDTVAQVAKLLTIDSTGKNATQAGFNSAHIVQYGFTWQFETNPTYWGSYWKAGSLYSGSPGSYTASLPAGWGDAWSWTYTGIWGPQPYIGSTVVEQGAFGGNPFNSGKVAMTIQPSWYTCCMGAVKNWDWAAMPSYNGVVGGRVDADTFRLMKYTTKPDEAFDFMAYLVTDGVEKLIVGAPPKPPAYGAISAITGRQNASIYSMVQRFPWVANWDTLLAGLNYPDKPSAESWMPNFTTAWNDLLSFGDKLRSTAGLDLTGEESVLLNQLTIDFNK